MSAALIARNDDLRRLDEEGFALEFRDGFLLVHNVPYVRTDRQLARGVLVTALALSASGETVRPISDHTLHFIGSTPCHRDGSPLNAVINSSERKELAPGLIVAHRFSSKPGDGQPYVDNYEKITAYERHLGGAARSIDPTANARTGAKVAPMPSDSPFAIPDTASSRYEIGDITAKLNLGRVAIIGLGGTGAHGLDHLTKTPVRRIDLYDGAQVLNHTLFRAPGAPVPEFLEGFPAKVDYYAKVYSRMHQGIVPHPQYVTADNIDQLAGTDFAFVCVDKGSARRVIAAGLQRLQIPFIDTGIGMDREGTSLDGVARVTFVPPTMPWSEVEKLLPFGDDQEEDDGVYKAAIQAGDLNALNATLAVMRFKRWLGYYRDSRGETSSAYMVEGNLIANRDIAG